MAGYDPIVIPPNDESQDFLPNICQARNLLLVIIGSELFAFIFALAKSHDLSNFWHDLALTSLFVQWVALSTAAPLCLVRKRFSHLNTRKLGFIAYSGLLISTLTWSLLTLLLWEEISAIDQSQSLDPVYFLLRNLAIATIVGLVALRYLYVQHQWKHNIRAESRAQITALQAKIRPHFLFNSLNTIASLTMIDPEKAEQAVLDLASVFRASLADRDRIPLEDEIAITRQHLGIETLRLGERLKVEWVLAENIPLNFPVPALILQPLVENAVYHGVQPLTEGGTITIDINVTGNLLAFEINNPYKPVPSEKEQNRRSNKMAQNNIRQRLALAFGSQSAFTVHKTDREYSVNFTIPLDEEV